MKTLQIALAAAGAIALLAATSPESQAQVWTYQWDTTTTTASSAAPVWTLSRWGSAVTNYYTNTPPAPLQLVSTTADGVTANLAKDSSYWNPVHEVGSTVEFRLQVENMSAGATNAALMTISNLTGSNGRWEIGFTDTGFRFFGDTVYTFDTTQMTTYRITFTNTSASLYVNDNPIPVLTRNSTISDTRANAISFGDPGSASGGVTHWEYIRWTNAGMFAPIPEPGTVAALLMGGGLMLGLGWRKRRL